MMRLAVLLLTVGAAAGFAKDEARNDFDPAIDFSRYRTFSFVKGVDVGHTGVLDDPVVRERVKNFVSGAMETRGLREVPQDEKYDLAVRYWLARLDKSEVKPTLSSSLDYGYWGGYPAYWYGSWATFYQEYVVENYIEGTLLVDLIDRETEQLVWRTYLRQDIKDRAKAYVEAKEHLYEALRELPPSADAKRKMQHDRDRLAKKYPQLK